MEYVWDTFQMVSVLKESSAIGINSKVNGTELIIDSHILYHLPKSPKQGNETKPNESIGRTKQIRKQMKNHDLFSLFWTNFIYKIKITTIARSILFILMLNPECRIRKKNPKFVRWIGIENTQRK